MTALESYSALTCEVFLWSNAASKLWTPDKIRLQKLYDRLVVEIDEESAVTLARDAGLTLAQSGICGAAEPFLRIAEEKGGLVPEFMSQAESVAVFDCGYTN